MIANGDGTDPSTPDTRSTPWRRAAVAALMTSAGKVPGGRVDDGLLRQDAAAPFGVRLDPDRVERAFTDAFQPGSVVLVEGSDLVRADIQAQFASDEQAVKMRARALEDTDRIVGRLLDHVEPADIVMVIGPTPPQDRDGAQRRRRPRPRLRPRAPALDHHATRRLRQPHRRRARPSSPTSGSTVPTPMEGRRMETGDTGGSLAERTESLVNANEDGLFRDGLVGPSMSVVIVVALILAVAAIVSTAGPGCARGGPSDSSFRRAVVARLPRRHVPRGAVPLRAQRWCVRLLVFVVVWAR